ncbi:MAG: glycine betaine ABC transporter substrate-binding protein, partial [Candidatus Krumholzibacteriia bacterium]
MCGADRIVVGSKNFSESRVLAEMFARLLEGHTDLEVERRLGLAGTQVCFEALRTGGIDLYPEYTGTGLVTLLDEPPQGDATWTLNHVRSEFLRRWNLWWIAPLGFENAYELAVPRELAEQHGLRTISDLARVSRHLKAGLGYEFAKREDGLPGLEKTYGLVFGEVRTMQQALKYKAVGERVLDCLDVYTTDGRLVVHDLVVLEDDKHFFPPYEAAALIRGETLARHPEIGSVLGLLAGAIPEQRMRELNLRVEEYGEPIERVAQDALEALSLIGAAPDVMLAAISI